MAESESGADKSEEPTEKRLRESREKGSWRVPANSVRWR